MWSSSHSYAQLIKASAGSGKTFQLTARMISLLLLGEDPSAILATTFTRKAAGEILSRLFAKLAAATVDESEKHSLIDSLKKLDFLESNSVSNEAPDNALLRLIARQHKLNVCTLDSFVLMVAQLYHLEGGLVEVPKIISSDEEEKITLEALNQLIELESPQAICSALYLIEGQTKSSSVLRPLRSLGVVLKHTHAEINDLLWPEAKDTLTSSTLNSEDIKKLVSRFLETPVPVTTQGRPNSHWIKGCATLSQKILERKWQEALGSSIIKALRKKESFYNKEAPDNLIEAASPLIDYAIQMLRYEMYQRAQAFISLAKKYSQILTGIKMGKSLFSFDELTNHLARSLSSESLNTVFFRLDTVYRHLMLDEFQDTALTQWQLIAPLAEEILSSVSPERTFFCVGDTKQAIYGWRGGVSSLFSFLEESYKNVLTTKPLTTCFRCSPAILSFTDTLFCNLNKAESIKSILPLAKPWLDKYSLHTSAKIPDATSEYNGFVAVCTQSDDKESIASCGLFTINAIKTILSIYNDNFIPSIGILTRTNETARYLQSFIKSEIDAESSLKDVIKIGSEAGALLCDIPAVKCLLSFLQFLDHPHDSISRYHLATSPMHVLVGTNDYKDDKTFEHLYQSIRREWTERGLANTLRNRLTVLFKSLDHSQYVALNASLLIIENIEKRNFCSRTSPFQFAIQKAASEGIDSTQVRVMTIHKSKGLEFDYVILPELDVPLINLRTRTGPIITQRDQQTFCPLRIFPRIPKELEWLFPEIPSAQVREHQELRALEDSLSLLYVSLTRARLGLFLLDQEEKDNISPNKVTYQSVIKDIFVDNIDPLDKKLGFVEVRYLEGQRPVDLQSVVNKPISQNTVNQLIEPTVHQVQPPKLSVSNFDQSKFLPHQQISLHIKNKLKHKNFLSELSLLKSYENVLRAIDWLEFDKPIILNDNYSDIKESDKPKVLDWLSRQEVQFVLNYKQCQSYFFNSFESDLVLQKNKRFLIQQPTCFLSGTFLRLVTGTMSNDSKAVLLITFDNDEGNLKKYRQALSIISGIDDQHIFSYSLPW